MTISFRTVDVQGFTQGVGQLVGQQALEIPEALGLVWCGMASVQRYRMVVTPTVQGTAFARQDRPIVVPAYSLHWRKGSEGQIRGSKSTEVAISFADWSDMPRRLARQVLFTCG